MAAAMATLIERIPATIGMARRASADRCRLSGTPALSWPSSQKNQPTRYQLAKKLPVVVSPDIDVLEVIHARPFQFSVGPYEPAGFDNVDGNTKAAAEAQDRSGVLGYVRLEERDSHTGVLTIVAAFAARSPRHKVRAPGFAIMRIHPEKEPICYNAV